MSSSILWRLQATGSLGLLSASPLELTEYDVRAIFILADRPKTPTEVADLAEIPRAKCYEVLNRLVNRGFADLVSEKPAVYSLSPRTIEQILESLTSNYQNLREILLDLKEVQRAGSRELFSTLNAAESTSRGLTELELSKQSVDSEIERLLDQGIPKLLAISVSEGYRSNREEIEREVERLATQTRNFRSLWLSNKAALRGLGILDSEAIPTLNGILESLRGIMERLQKSESALREIVLLSERREESGLYRISPSIPRSPSESDMLDQGEAKAQIGEAIERLKKTGGISLALIVGPHGAGKSLFLRLVHSKANRGDYGKLVSGYSIARADLLGTYDEFTSDLVLSLVSSELNVAWPPSVEKASTFLSLIRSFNETMNAMIEKYGARGLVWLIDDLDRVLRDDGTQFMRELVAFIDSASEKPVAIVFATSEEGYRILEATYPEFVSRVSTSGVIRLRPLEEDDVKRLLSKGAGERIEAEAGALRDLVDASSGNPRRIIQMLNDALYQMKGSGRITRELIRRITPQAP